MKWIPYFSAARYFTVYMLGVKQKGKKLQRPKRKPSWRQENFCSQNLEVVLNLNLTYSRQSTTNASTFIDCNAARAEPWTQPLTVGTVVMRVLADYELPHRVYWTTYHTPSG